MEENEGSSPARREPRHCTIMLLCRRTHVKEVAAGSRNHRPLEPHGWRPEAFSFIGVEERSLAMYKYRSTAVEDVGRYCEEEAEALRHHATTEEDTREGGHRWLFQLTTSPSNLMDGVHKLRAAKKIHVPHRQGRLQKLEAPVRLVKIGP
jgi:hypothetical protein